MLRSISSLGIVFVAGYVCAYLDIVPWLFTVLFDFDAIHHKATIFSALLLEAVVFVLMFYVPLDSLSDETDDLHEQMNIEHWKRFMPAHTTPDPAWWRRGTGGSSSQFSTPIYRSQAPVALWSPTDFFALPPREL